MTRFSCALALVLALTVVTSSEALRLNVDVLSSHEEDPEQDKCQKCLAFCEEAPFGKDICKQICEKVCQFEAGWKCGLTLFDISRTCLPQGDGCDACVEQGMPAIQDACGEEVEAERERVTQAICKKDTDSLVQEEVAENPEQDKCQKCLAFCEDAPFGKDKCKQICEKVCEFEAGWKCGRTLFATSHTCLPQGDGCGACVEQGMSKIQDACGDEVEADRVTQAVCKGRGQDDEKDGDAEEVDALLQEEETRSRCRGKNAKCDDDNDCCSGACHWNPLHHAGNVCSR